MEYTLARGNLTSIFKVLKLLYGKRPKFCFSFFSAFNIILEITLNEFVNLFMYFKIFPEEIAFEDFAAAEIVKSLEDVQLRATKQHGKNLLLFEFISILVLSNPLIKATF